MQENETVTARNMFGTNEENEALRRFRIEHPEFFKKEDWRLALHLALVISLAAFFITLAVTTPFLSVKILLGAANAFLFFSLINVTIHHHHTHHNAAKSPFFKKLLDTLYFIVLPNAPRRLVRYTRAHLNHHARPFDETDVDHHYGTNQFFRMQKTFFTKAVYFLELTFIGAHVPGWEDDRYMNQVPMDQWNQKDYERVKALEKRKALVTAGWQWGGFFLLLFFVPGLAWGWAFPMLLVKNWAHFLGQFQHYDTRLLEDTRSVWNRTKSYLFPGWLNYLCGGEISGHFLHHLFPEMPYYNVERARKVFSAQPELKAIFVTY